MGKQRVHAGGTARWGDAYLHHKGYQRLEQMGGGLPAAPGQAGLWRQVGADSFQLLSQFLQPDTVPPSNPKLAVCLLNPIFPLGATLPKGGGQRKLNSKPFCRGRLARLDIPAGICYLLLSLRHPQQTSWKQMQEATWYRALHVSKWLPLADRNVPVPGRTLGLGKWECPPLAEAKHPRAQLPTPCLLPGRHRSQWGVRQHASSSLDLAHLRALLGLKPHDSC